MALFIVIPTFVIMISTISRDFTMVFLSGFYIFLLWQCLWGSFCDMFYFIGSLMLKSIHFSLYSFYCYLYIKVCFSRKYVYIHINFSQWDLHYSHNKDTQRADSDNIHEIRVDVAPFCYSFVYDYIFDHPISLFSIATVKLPDYFYV